MHRDRCRPIFQKMSKMKLIAHHEYIVRGTKMFFWRLRDDVTPEFYHYQKYGDTRHIIYFWDKDLKVSQIEGARGPMIHKLSTELVDVVHN